MSADSDDDDHTYSFIDDNYEKMYTALQPHSDHAYTELKQVYTDPGHSARPTRSNNGRSDLGLGACGGSDAKKDQQHGKELQDWGSREGLSPDVITVLLVQGFESLTDLRHLSRDDVTECFQKTGLLPLAKCLALRNAVGRLSGRGPHDEWPGTLNEEFRLLLVDGTGRGKSTTGNTIQCELKRFYRDGRKIEIMDTPDLFDTSKNNEEVGAVIIQSVACMYPGPNAILYVVKVGRYTDEEYSAYTRLKALFDPSITRHMIVLFTGGDQLETVGKSIVSLLRTAPMNLTTVLTECSHRYVLFNNFATDPRPQVERLLDMVSQLNHQNGGPYVCPKYGKIGESLEAEVARRMEEVDKKELER